jgi:hypothetical protein
VIGAKVGHRQTIGGVRPRPAADVGERRRVTAVAVQVLAMQAVVDPRASPAPARAPVVVLCAAAAAAQRPLAVRAPAPVVVLRATRAGALVRATRAVALLRATADVVVLRATGAGVLVRATRAVALLRATADVVVLREMKAGALVPATLAGALVPATLARATLAVVLPPGTQAARVLPAMLVAVPPVQHVGLTKGAAPLAGAVLLADVPAALAVGRTPQPAATLPDHTASVAQAVQHRAHRVHVRGVVTTYRQPAAVARARTGGNPAPNPTTVPEDRLALKPGHLDRVLRVARIATVLVVTIAASVHAVLVRTGQAVSTANRAVEAGPLERQLGDQPAVPEMAEIMTVPAARAHIASVRGIQREQIHDREAVVAAMRRITSSLADLVRRAVQRLLSPRMPIRACSIPRYVRSFAR